MIRLYDIHASLSYLVPSYRKMVRIHVENMYKEHFLKVFPPDESKKRPLTRLQERLKKKLGDNAYPFWFTIPAKSASSVTLQPAPGDTGKVYS